MQVTLCHPFMYIIDILLGVMEFMKDLIVKKKMKKLRVSLQLATFHVLHSYFGHNFSLLSKISM